MGEYSVNLLEKLGQGSFGVVYMGKENKTGRTVAVKQMKLEDEQVGEKLSKSSSMRISNMNFDNYIPSWERLQLQLFSCLYHRRNSTR